MSARCVAKKASPVLVVDSVAEAMALWRDRLEFSVTAEVPLAGAAEIGFAILENGPVEVMLQSRASIAADVPALATGAHRTTLFVEVADVAAVERAVRGCEIVVPRRRTFYGADEVGVRAPGGHIVVFAQMTGA